MLVLTRKRQQQIQIGDNITVTICRVKGATVQIGIDAPQKVHIVRGELARREEAKAESEKLGAARLAFPRRAWERETQ